MDMIKLTVRVPQDVLDRAKVYAGEHDTSLSRLISEYLRHLSPQDELLAGAPTVQRLSGILSPDMAVDDYRRYLDEKYEHPYSDSH
jgi:hypothetical protein